MKKLTIGFTLVEMLLVMVIISIIIFAGTNYIQQQALATRQDRASFQMQQILNAALSYYVVNANWPSSLACLQGIGGGTCTQQYLPKTLNNPWNQTYNFIAPSVGGKPPVIGYVYTSVTAAAGSNTGSAQASANVIAGKLPLAYTTSTNGSPPPAPGSGGTACTNTTTACFVVASANIPGQNLNNATGVNFAGLYHHGACVPVPQCPVDANGNTMTPQVFVVPVSVSGVNDTSNPSYTYPISSFSAYATAPTTLPALPPACQNGTQSPCGPYSPAGVQPNQAWRVCLQIVTEKGEVAQTRTDAWGKDVTLAAFTRCAITNEPAGSNLFVFTK